MDTSSLGAAGSPQKPTPCDPRQTVIQIRSQITQAWDLLTQATAEIDVHNVEMVNVDYLASVLRMAAAHATIATTMAELMFEEIFLDDGPATPLVGAALTDIFADPPAVVPAKGGGA